VLAAVANDSRDLIYRDEAMAKVIKLAQQIAGSDASVMITGESGTGKEVLARYVHTRSNRAKRPFISINCAAIPEHLLESELFGHEKGAFTGALGRGVGRFEQAAGGTLFLDEIGDMPPDAQTRLLRVLQDGEFTTVGGRQPIKADLRIVAATHRDLRQAIRQGQFREDLFYRLNVVPIRLPPLRERKEDIADLARHFLAAGAPAGEQPKALDAAAQERLRGHSWPGNVRELENLMRRMAVLYSQPVIGADIIEAELAGSSPQEPDLGGRAESLSEATGRHLRQYFSAHQPGLPASGLYDRVLREVERPLLAIALEATRGNQIKAAELLGINRNTLRKKIRELDIEILRSLR
jgi:two-component system nitrogen regulation response regulator GlnG